MLDEIGGLKPTRNMLVDEQVAIFLHILSHHVKNRVIQFRFGWSGETVSRYFHTVLKTMIPLMPHLFKKLEAVADDSTDERWKWLKGCLDALDGTHIRIRVPREDQPRYRNRKGEITTNVLGVCTRDELFVYIMPGWEGSVVDSRVLQSTILKPNGLKVPEGQYYLVDAGFINGPGFLAPYRGQRYHLSEWREGRNPTNPKECFNMRHSSARNVIERCFGMLKKRWAILRNPSFYPVRTHNRIILCCCLLHNLIREHSVLDPLENQVYEDTQQVDCDIVGTIETSNAWTAFRDTLAVDMFNDFRGRRGLNHHHRRRFWVKQHSNHRFEAFSLDPVLDEMLVQSVMELFEIRQFEKKESNKKLQKKMVEKWLGCGIKANPHIQSCLKTMKVNWSAVYELANASGFGWDPVRNCVYADDAVWNQYIKTHPKAAAWCHKTFPHYDELTKVWAKDRATGIGMEDTNDMYEEASSSSSKKMKRACVDRDDKYVEALKQMSRMMDITVKEASEKLTDKLCASFDRSANEDALIVEELQKLVGFTPLELYHAHEKLKSSKMLWSLFNEALVESKENFIHGIIGGME
ncbi:protein ALP1-like [Senna tora]|uniref:Protein ALP1-like n=1 Tax=Senna tora TaxID=362788 RepID=A0A834SG24_9FABA|nr:protein ALP1-like [Senna tora]